MYSEGWVAQTYTETVNGNHIYCEQVIYQQDVYSFRENNVNYTQFASGGSQGPNGFALGSFQTQSEYGTGTNNSSFSLQ